MCGKHAGLLLAHDKSGFFGCSHCCCDSLLTEASFPWYSAGRRKKTSAMPCHAMPSHKRFDTWPSFKQGNDRLNTTHKLVIVRNVSLEVFPLFFLTYECYAVHGVQALGASKLFCCHKYFRVPKLGLFYAFCGLFSLRARFDLRCSLALLTSIKSLFLCFLQSTWQNSYTHFLPLNVTIFISCSALTPTASHGMVLEYPSSKAFIFKTYFWSPTVVRFFDSWLTDGSTWTRQNTARMPGKIGS